MTPRPIEYRSYNKVTGEMTYNVAIMGDTTTEQGDEVLMQFTGKLDRDGVKIFEDDIVRNRYRKDNGFKAKSSDDNELISWDRDNFCYNIGDFMALSEAAQSQETTLEVIGNRWQNPELIKSN